MPHSLFLLLLIAQGVIASNSLFDIYGCRYAVNCPRDMACREDLLFGHCGLMEDFDRFDFGFALDESQALELGQLLAGLRSLKLGWFDLETQQVLNDFLAFRRIFGLRVLEEPPPGIPGISQEYDDYGVEDYAENGIEEQIEEANEDEQSDDDNHENQEPQKKQFVDLVGEGKRAFNATDLYLKELEKEGAQLDAGSSEYLVYDYDPELAQYLYENPEAAADAWIVYQQMEEKPKESYDIHPLKREDEDLEGLEELQEKQGDPEELDEYLNEVDDSGEEDDDAEIEQIYQLLPFLADYFDGGEYIPDSDAVEYFDEDFEDSEDERLAEESGEDEEMKRAQMILYKNNGEVVGELPVVSEADLVDDDYCFITTSRDLEMGQAERLLEFVHNNTAADLRADNHISIDGKKVTFFVDHADGADASEVARQIMDKSDEIQKKLGIEIEATGIGQEDNERIMYSAAVRDTKSELVLLSVAMLGCVVGLLAGVLAILLVKGNRKKLERMRRLSNVLDTDKVSPAQYQDLCREHKATSEKAAGGGGAGGGNAGSGGGDDSNRSSVSSWNEEPMACNMDISTGHIVLSYMETHLHDKTQLEEEWTALTGYEPDDVSFARATSAANVDKNRYPTCVPFDHNAVGLDSATALGYGSYINASAIRDTHPEKAAYIMAQAPLDTTVPDFWQMVWEQRCTVAILFAGPFNEDGAADQGIVRFWPKEGNAVYHNFEIHLVSEHVWCEDYLVRSLYLKNLLTSQTRTVTLFHFLTWPAGGVPLSTRAVLEFRRKVNKAYKGKSSPVIVMCSSGSDQSGCYVLIDMVLSKIHRGAKEIDMSATLEHIRDQRVAAVSTKEQFEFCLSTVAEEVNSILKAIDNQQ